MDLDYKISELTEKDLDKKLGGFVNTLKFLDLKVGMLPRQAKKILQNLKSHRGEVYVAEKSSGEIIGTLTMYVSQKFSNGEDNYCRIDDFVVRKKYLNYGVEEELLKKVVEKAKSIGCENIFLNCDERLIKFYEEMDFKQSGIEMKLEL